MHFCINFISVDRNPRTRAKISEYCAGPVNVCKCVSSAGSDYIEYEGKPAYKTNLRTSGTGTFSCSELYFSNLLYLLLQITSL